MLPDLTQPYMTLVNVIGFIIWLPEAIHCEKAMQHNVNIFFFLVNKQLIVLWEFI